MVVNGRNIGKGKRWCRWSQWWGGRAWDGVITCRGEGKERGGIGDICSGGIGRGRGGGGGRGTSSGGLKIVSNPVGASLLLAAGIKVLFLVDSRIAVGGGRVATARRAHN